jgi:hypothetical protein
VHSILAVCIKEIHAPINQGDGVSTYLALTFSTLLSSQRTDASHRNPVTGHSGRFPLGVHYFSGFPSRLLIGAFGVIYGTPINDPLGKS